MFSDALPFASNYVCELSDELHRRYAGRSLGKTQQGWLSFCLTGLLLTGSLCWAAFERTGLGSYRVGALSWMFRSSKLPWSGLLQASRAGCGSPSAPGLSSPTGCRRYRTARPAVWRSHAGGSSPASRNPAHAKAICLAHSLQSLRKDRLRANACCRSMRAEKAGWSVVSP